MTLGLKPKHRIKLQLGKSPVLGRVTLNHFVLAQKLKLQCAFNGKIAFADLCQMKQTLKAAESDHSEGTWRSNNVTGGLLLLLESVEGSGL